MRRTPAPSLLLILGAAAAASAFAETSDLPKGLRGTSIGALWYLSYQYRAEHDPADSSNTVYRSAFVVKRGYINIKKSLTPWLGARITPDVRQDSSGDFKVRLKYIYADFKLPDAAFLCKPHIEWGLVHRPWLDFEEHIDYYRLQDPMFLERNGLLNSADVGFTFFSLLGGEMDEEYQTKVNSKYPGKYGSIAMGIYNGGGYHAGENNNKKVPELRITLRPLPEIVPGLQLTYFGVYGHGNTARAPEWQVNTAFLSLEHERFVATGTYYRGKGTSGGEVDDKGKPMKKEGYSGFIELKFPATRMSLIGRYDWFDHNRNASRDETARIIAGIAFHLHEHTKIVVDFDQARYDAPGQASDSRIQATTEVHF